jgi:hypothetical protein
MGRERRKRRAEGGNLSSEEREEHSRAATGGGDRGRETVKRGVDSDGRAQLRSESDRSDIKLQVFRNHIPDGSHPFCSAQCEVRRYVALRVDV